MKVKNVKVVGRVDGYRKDALFRAECELLDCGWVKLPCGKVIPPTKVLYCAVVDEQVEESPTPEASAEEAGGKEKGGVSAKPEKAPRRTAAKSGTRRK